MMKQLMIGMALLFTLTVQAQKPHNTSKRVRVAGFGGLITEFAKLNGQHTTWIGGGAGVILNNVHLGGYGLGLSSDVFRQVDGQDLRLSFGHGGFWTRVDILSNQLIHFALDVKTGWGSINFVQPNGQRVFNNQVFVFIPSLGFNLNITRFFKLGVTAGYRLVEGIRQNEFSSLEFSTPVVGMSCKFGWW